MKKLFLTLSIAVALQNSSFAQWDPSGANIYNTNSGNVGIGTTSPGSKLDIQTTYGVGVSGAYGLSRIITAVNDIGLSIGQSNVARHLDLFAYGINQQNEDLYLSAISHNIVLQNSGGNVGVGVATPVYKLDIGGDIHFGSTTSGLSLTNNMFHNRLDAVGSDANIGIDVQTKGVGSFTVNGNMIVTDGYGKVGIGTSSPDEKLTVAGTIHSTEVKVTPSVLTPDYVFEPEYKLTGLEEIKAYVDKNHHLPEIPSAKEIENDGIKVGDISMKLLKTIEELTLHVIELNNQVKAQNEKIATLENQLKK